MKAKTVEQFYIIKWIEENFYIEHLKVTIVDRCNIRIKDANDAEAVVTYKSKDNIVLKEVNVTDD